MSHKPEVQSLFNAEMLFSFSWLVGTIGMERMFCNPCKEHGLYSSKYNMFLFVPAQWWILWRPYEMPKPLGKPTSGNA